MTVDVFAPTYDSAAAALLGVNHDSASTFLALTGHLGGSGAMAGDDATSTDFAREHDTQAQVTIDALRAFVDASGNLAVLTATSIENHRKGNAAARYTAPPLVPDHCLIPIGAGEVDVQAYRVPTSEGGDAGDLPTLLDVVIDHVQGVAWPNADTTLLRKVAVAWRGAATALDRADDGCRNAIEHLREQRSPEIPLAVDAVRDLRNGATDLAAACRSLALACEEYTQQVDDHRELIKEILEALAIEAGITVAGGVVVSVLSFGLGAAGASGLLATRAAVHGARIVAVLNKLKAAVRLGAIARLTTAGEKARKVAPVMRRLATRSARTGRAGGRRLLPRKAKWGKPQTLERHVRDHGADFGVSTADDYVRKAEEFYSNGTRRRLPTKVAPDGTIRMYDPSSNTFISLDADGGIKTFFKPTSSTYWDRQIGRLL